MKGSSCIRHGDQLGREAVNKFRKGLRGQIVDISDYVVKRRKALGPRRSIVEKQHQRVGSLGTAINGGDYLGLRV